MEDEQETIKLLQKEAKKIKGYLEISDEDRKNSKGLLKTALVALTYIGARQFLGPEMDIFAGERLNVYQFFDGSAFTILFSCGIVGGLLRTLSYFEGKSDKRYLERIESKLEGLMS